MPLPDIAPLDRSAEPALRARIDGKAKPLGALGRIEDLAITLALIQRRPDPRVDHATLLVFAGDHGLTAEGVSAYPAAVTVAMVSAFLSGGATASVFARTLGVDLRVIDAGVAAPLGAHAGLIDAKVALGTRNAAVEPAMTRAEADLALARGAEQAQDAIGAGAQLLAIGEMGIGNSASAALLMHRLAPAPLAECVGMGTGHDAAGLAAKHAALARAAARSDATDPLEVLRQFGGFEIAMMAGAMLGAAARDVPVLVDGFIASAAALVAVRLQPDVRPRLLFAHCSAEAGHARMLAAMAADPLLRLDMRLGEGSGALLAVPLLRAACALINDVASLDQVLAGLG